MKALMERENPRVVIDATHPYAAEVTANIRLACGGGQEAVSASAAQRSSGK